METSLDPARRDELIGTIASRVRGWNLTMPAVLCLQLVQPVSFLTGQLLLLSGPFLGLVAGDRLARDLALLSEEPENIERLIAVLEA